MTSMIEHESTGMGFFPGVKIGERMVIGCYCATLMYAILYCDVQGAG